MLHHINPSNIKPQGVMSKDETVTTVKLCILWLETIYHGERFLVTQDTMSGRMGLKTSIRKLWSQRFYECCCTLKRQTLMWSSHSVQVFDEYVRNKALQELWNRAPHRMQTYLKYTVLCKCLRYSTKINNVNIWHDNTLPFSAVSACVWVWGRNTPLMGCLSSEWLRPCSHLVLRSILNDPTTSGQPRRIASYAWHY